MKMSEVFKPSWHKVFLFCFALLVGVFALGALKVSINNDASSSLLTHKGLDAKRYEQYLENFKSDCALVIKLPSSFIDQLPPIVEALSDENSIPEVDEVIGITNATYIKSTDEGMRVAEFEDLFGELSSQQVLDIALAYQPFHRKLISEDGKYIAIYLRVKKESDLPAGAHIDAVAITASVTEVMQQFPTAAAAMQLGGEVPFSAALSKETQAGTAVVVAVMVAMGIIIGMMTKSIITGILGGINGILGFFFTIGLMGFLGIEQDPLNALMVNLVVALGAAFVILAHDYIHHHNDRWLLGIIPSRAIKPFLMASGTTMIGFGVTAISSYQPIVELGLLGAFGILACLVSTMLLVFPVLTFKGKGRIKKQDFGFADLGFTSTRATRKNLLPAMALLGVISLILAWQVQVNYDSAQYLKKSHPARQAADGIAETFGARYTMAMTLFDVDALDVVMWQKLNDFCNHLKTDPNYGGIEVASIADSLAVFAQEFTADQEKPLEFPDSPELIAQSLMLFDDSDIEPYINFDRTAVNVLLQTPFSSSVKFRQLEKEVAEFASQTGYDAVLTGRVSQYYRASDVIAVEDLESTGIGLVAIFLIFLGVFRSLRLAIIGITANIFPLLGCLAFFGLFGVAMDTASALVLSIAMGIIVDDTIHIIIEYLKNVKEKGMGSWEAADWAISRKRKPVLRTTIAIVAGFSVMNVATLVPFHTFAQMMSLTLVYAWVWDRYFLPWMLGRYGVSAEVSMPTHLEILQVRGVETPNTASYPK